MKKTILLFLGLLVFITACTTSNNYKISASDIICPDKYLKIGIDCCLDTNDNQICDRDDEYNRRF